MASDVSTKDVQTLTETPANTSSFEPGSSYGKLVMIILFWMHLGEEMGMDCYCSTLSLEHFRMTLRKKWRADIVFSYTLESCLKVCTHLRISVMKQVLLILA